MSQYSFIFFPREVDLKHFFELCSQTGLYNFSDLKRFKFLDPEKLQKYSGIFQNELFSGAYLTPRPDLSFAGDIQNKFCYCLDGSFYYKPALLAEGEKSYIENRIDEDFEFKMLLEMFISSEISRNMLYNFIKESINSGEFVEIYSEWLDEEWKDLWGPPLRTEEFELEDLLSFNKLSFQHCERAKYVIHKK